MNSRVFTFVLGMAICAGCRDGRPDGDLPPLYPVRGTVVLDNQAATGGGTIRFQPEPDLPDLSVTGVVNGDGSFELQTIHALSQKKGSGAPAGHYKVTFVPSDGGGRTAGRTTTNPVTATVTYQIQPGSNEMTIKLPKQ